MTLFLTTPELLTSAAFLVCNVQTETSFEAPPDFSGAFALTYKPISYFACVRVCFACVVQT